MACSFWYINDRQQACDITHHNCNVNMQVVFLLKPYLKRAELTTRSDHSHLHSILSSLDAIGTLTPLWIQLFKFKFEIYRSADAKSYTAGAMTKFEKNCKNLTSINNHLAVTIVGISEATSKATEASTYFICYMNEHKVKEPGTPMIEVDAIYETIDLERGGSPTLA